MAIPSAIKAILFALMAIPSFLITIPSAPMAIPLTLPVWKIKDKNTFE
jgi:hypothetical protein